GVPAVEKRGAGRDRQQHRQDGTQAVAHAHGPVGSADADVDVQRERVVAPGHVLEPVLDTVVVVGVDDVLAAVVGERMRSGGAELDVVGGGQREQPAAQLALGGTSGGQVLPAAGPDLDLRGDQLTGDGVGQQ